MNLALLPKFQFLVRGLLAFGLLATASCQRPAPAESTAPPTTSTPVQERTRTMVPNEAAEEALRGAWQLANTTDRGRPASSAVIIMVDGQFTVADYDISTKRFIGAAGGTWSYRQGRYEQHLEYNTLDSTLVGTTLVYTPDLQGTVLRLVRMQAGRQVEETWEQIDPAQGPMAGAWRIEGRNPQTGGRKTIKWLSDTRFQWAAINPETKQFFGTGGGTYTVQDGKYTEHIEFFSRDPNRVGMSLTFDHALEGGKWRHSGLSTAGKQINEVWAKEPRVGR